MTPGKSDRTWTIFNWIVGAVLLALLGLALSGVRASHDVGPAYVK